MNKLLAIIQRGCAKYRDLSVASRSIDLRYFCFGKLREAWFHLRMSKILFAAKQSWTTLRMSRPLFVDSYLTVTWNNKHMSWKFTTLELISLGNVMGNELQLMIHEMLITGKLTSFVLMPTEKGTRLIWYSKRKYPKHCLKTARTGRKPLNGWQVQLSVKINILNDHLLHE